eukprot:2769830-Rhodomonas_salina.1
MAQITAAKVVALEIRLDAAQEGLPQLKTVSVSARAVVGVEGNATKNQVLGQKHQFVGSDLGIKGEENTSFGAVLSLLACVAPTLWESSVTSWIEILSFEANLNGAATLHHPGSGTQPSALESALRMQRTRGGATLAPCPPHSSNHAADHSSLACSASVT